MEGVAIHPNSLIQHLHCVERLLGFVFCNWFEAQRYQPAVLPCAALPFPLLGRLLLFSNLLLTRCRGSLPHTVVTVHCVFAVFLPASNPLSVSGNLHCCSDSQVL